MTLQLLSLFFFVSTLSVCIVLGANNASACIGASAGTISVKYLVLATVSGLGVIIGWLVEGNKLSNAIYGGVLANQNDKATAIILITTLIVMGAATAFKLPLSITQAMVGAAISMGLFLDITTNWWFVILVLASWIVTPVVAAIISVGVYYMIKGGASRIGSIFQRGRMYALLALAGSWYIGYALGANSVGMIGGIFQSTTDLALLSVIVPTATVVGIFALGRGVTRTLSEKVLTLTGVAAVAVTIAAALTVELFTQVGVPVAITQAVTGGIIGIGQAKEIAIMNRRILLRIVLSWILAPVAGLVLAWVLAVAV